MRNANWLILCGCLAASVCAPVEARAQRLNREVMELQAEASKHFRAKDYAAAQAAWEKALGLTPATDLKDRVNLYRSLLACYRMLPTPEKFTEAVEYIQLNSEQSAERSTVMTDFASFLFQRGLIDTAVKTYEARLQKDGDDYMALAVLSKIYLRSGDARADRGGELNGKLQALNRARTAKKAEALSAVAADNRMAEASNWKDVAVAWMEIDEKAKALAAVEKSLAAAPEARSTTLTMFWRDGLGDVLSKMGDKARAIQQYEAAESIAPGEVLKKPIRTKLDALKAAKG